MKTRVISTIGLALLGVVAGGCGAEPGSGSGPGSRDGEPGVGTIGNPLVVAPLPAARVFAASCIVEDGGNEKMIVFGGSSDGTNANAKNDTYIYDAAKNAWTTSTSTTKPTAVTNPKMKRIPGTNSCLLAGGADNTGTAVNQGYIFDLLSDTWRATGNMNTTRKDFELIQVGAGAGSNARFLAIGGQNAAGGYLAQVELYDVRTKAWTNVMGLTLTPARSKLAVAALNTSYDKIIVVGGETAAATYSNKIDVITSDLLGSTPVIAASAAVLGTARENLTLFPSGDPATLVPDSFLAVGGENGAAQNVVDVLKVTNWTTGAITRTAGTAITTARTNLKAVQFTDYRLPPNYLPPGSTPGLYPEEYQFPNMYAVIGGNTTAAVTTGLNPIQWWDTAQDPKVWATETTMGTPRTGFVAEYLPVVGRIAVFGGYTTPAGTVVATGELL